MFINGVFEEHTRRLFRLTLFTWNLLNLGFIFTKQSCLLLEERKDLTFVSIEFVCRSFGSQVICIGLYYVYLLTIHFSNVSP